MTKYRTGQLIVYANGNRAEIGKIKRIVDDGAFVFYHSGCTAAKTRFEDMRPIVNDCYITETTLGALYKEGEE